MAVDVLDNTFNNNSTNSTPLLHELQLGEELNNCLHQSRRSDFSLMLAMLCDDVREQSQFILPKSLPIDGTAADKKLLDTQTLRKYFDLPNEMPLALKNMQEIKRYNQGQLIAENNLTSLHLSDVLSPKPLAFRNNAKHISYTVLTNTSLSCQEKLKLKQDNTTINKPLDMHIQGWLKTIQTSLVESKLVDVAA